MDFSFLPAAITAFQPLAWPVFWTVAVAVLGAIIIVLLVRNKNLTSPIGSLSQPTVSETKELRAEPTTLVLPDPTPNLAKIESAIRENLANNPEPMKSLVRELAVTRVRFYAEGVYSSIYGSQIKLLQLLSEKGGALTMTAVKRQFAAAKKDFPQPYEPWGVETYLQYLVTNGLVVNENEKLCLTDLARDFLTVIENEKPANSRPF